VAARIHSTKRKAQEFAEQVEVDKRSGSYVAPKLGRVTMAELAVNWLARKQKAAAPSHYRTLETAWRVHVQPRWGAVAVADVDLLGVEDWITDMSDKSATVVLRAYGVLSGILADAVKGKRLPANLAKGVENLPRKTGERRVYLSADDVARLADESGEHRVLVLVLAYTGIRWGEAIGLRVRDVQFLRRRLSVQENAVQIGVVHAVGPTKGREARSVSVPEFVLNELSTLCAGKAPGALVFGDGARYLPRPKSSNGWFRRAVKAAGVQHVTPHALRHSCASLAVSAGVNVLVLARMLGHNDPSVTLRVCADRFDDDLDAVALSLHAKFSPEITPHHAGNVTQI
jgi:integrase